MKNLNPIKFDPIACEGELNEFRQLLQERELSEYKDILPFFRKRLQLSALLGWLHPSIVNVGRIALEFGVVGDFRADLVVGDRIRGAYCLIEFEEGKADSIFKKSGRSKDEWAPRFEHGFSQVVDWFWKLDDISKTDHFEEMFGTRSADILGVLVIGRSSALSQADLQRLDWRRRKLVVNSQHIQCVTFDELYEELVEKFALYREMARLEK